MDTNTMNRKPESQVRLDWYTLSRDIVKEWTVIIMVGLAAFFFSFSWQYTHYSPTYTTSVTFTVNGRGATTDIYMNLSSAAETASGFTQLLNSEILQKKVAEEIGYTYMPGTVTAEAVENTNLMKLTVVENTPKMAYDVLHAIINNYDKVSRSLIGNVVLNILIKPTLPEHPDVVFAPMRDMVKHGLEGAFLMVILLGLVSFFKDTVRREEDVEVKLDTTLLGTLCHEEKYKTWKSRMKKGKKSILVTDPTVSFRYSESSKKLAGKISRKMERNHYKTILVTSVLENEGKSTVAANLAISLAEKSNKVLLLDGDLRKPALYKLLRIDVAEVHNFGEALNGKKNLQALIYKKRGTELSLILNTIHYPDSTDMISQDIMKKIIRYLKRYYDYIIIDSSPMALVSDTQEILNMSDAAILVVKQHTATVRDINDMIAVLNRNKRKLLGCIFNDVGGENSKFTYGGYGRYGKYNNYGHYGNRYNYGYENYADTAGEEVNEEMDKAQQGEVKQDE